MGWDVDVDVAVRRRRQAVVVPDQAPPLTPARGGAVDGLLVVAERQPSEVTNHGPPPLRDHPLTHHLARPRVEVPQHDSLVARRAELVIPLTPIPRRAGARLRHHSPISVR